MDILKSSEDILNSGISGFHRYILTDPTHLTFVSSSFCEMTGYTEKELLDDERDIYKTLVFPEDRDKYSDFINSLKTGGQTRMAEYRLIKKDGSVICVSDICTSQEQPNGDVEGFSVLCDITETKQQSADLKTMSKMMPVGFLKYTCEKQPKVTYLNEHMIELLRLPKPAEGETDYLELYKDNVFLMIPMEERRRFALYLNRVYMEGKPIAGDITLLRFDGTRVHIFGWVAKCVNERGEEEFQSICMDVTERHLAKKDDETRRYINALREVFDKIFEYDMAASTVKCLYSNNSPMFKWLENIPMKMDEATEKWISETVVEDDAGRVRAFFDAFGKRKLYDATNRPPQITYLAQSSSGEIKRYKGIFLRMDDTVSLYCCRCITNDMQEAALLDGVSLKENMQDLFMRFTDGIAAFEMKDGMVTPLYASDNVCEFFGYTREEWLELMKTSTSLESFLARGRVTYGHVKKLLSDGEEEFSYTDVQSGKNKRIKAICSQKFPGGSSPRYIMLYSLDGESRGDAGAPSEPGVTIRTFGYFDVFVGDRPIAFRNKKSKELFALLVDRRGGFVSSEEAIAFLWEDEPVSPLTLARYRKVALRLKNILEEYGISDVVETVDGKRRIVTQKVRCDLYDYLSGDEEYSQLFKGSYLTNYSWGENTLAELTGAILRE